MKKNMQQQSQDVHMHIHLQEQQLAPKEARGRMACSALLCHLKSEADDGLTTEGCHHKLCIALAT